MDIGCDYMNKSKWTNKQWWRYRQAYQFIIPPLSVFRDVMWILTSIALLGWFTLTLDLGVLVLAIVNIGLWGIGYAGDKTGFWQEWGARAVKITNVEVQEHLFQWQGDIISKGVLDGLKPAFPMIDTTFLDERIEKEKEWFEVRERGDENNG
jgi:hypothetical protein